MMILILGLAVLISGFALFRKAMLHNGKIHKYHLGGEGQREALAEYQRVKRESPDAIKANESEQEFVNRYMKENEPNQRRGSLMAVLGFFLIIPGLLLTIIGIVMVQ